MKNRIVKIPILFDDFDMYKHGLPYDDWEQRAIETLRRNDFIAFSLHDCYAHFWLPRYESFLRKVSVLGTFKTLDEVANAAIFAGAE